MGARLTSLPPFSLYVRLRRGNIESDKEKPLGRERKVSLLAPLSAMLVETCCMECTGTYEILSNESAFFYLLDSLDAACVHTWEMIDALAWS